ncbi:MAG: CotH kinase family protein [Calditrichia bacterium]
MKSYILLCIIALTVLLLPFSLSAQLLPEHPLFQDESIVSFEVTIDPDSLAAIFNDPWSDHEYPASVIVRSTTLDDTLPNIGFRLRGNTSRAAEKKSFKISINSFEAGRKYLGLEKINLNGEHNDPSIARSRLSWELAKSYGLNAARTHYSQLYINGSYYGVYIHVEQIDENFIKARFENDSGNLYKCLWPADLTWRGNDPDVYKFQSGGRRTYDLKTNRVADDYSDLAHFIDVLNLTPDGSFASAIQNVFNVNGYLKALALEIAIGHWDNYWFNKNNYYLYNNPATGKFEYIIFDLDNTFGIWWDGIQPGVDWGNRDIYNWGKSTQRALAERILDVDIFRDRFSFYLKQLTDDHFNAGILFPKAYATRDLLAPAALDDIYRTLDYGFTYQDFLDSYGQSLGGHVTYGITTYIGTRSNSINSQLVLNNIPPIISQTTYSPSAPDLNDPILVTTFVEDEDAVVTMQLYYSINNLWQTAIEMRDDGLSGDREANDGIYGATIPALTQPSDLAFYVSGRDSESRLARDPFNAPQTVYSIPLRSEQPKLFINEFMASNSTTIADPFGEFDDWVEIFNGDSIAISLEDFYLSDNFNLPRKWQLPNRTIAPGEFLLIWADDDPTQGAVHAPFKLDKDGEQIGIFAADSSVVDTISFGLQETDISFGRPQDGAVGFISITSPSPGTSNGSPTGLDPNTHSIKSFQLAQNYPNPFNGTTLIPFYLEESGFVEMNIYNQLGQEVRTIISAQLAAGEHRYSWDARSDDGEDIGSGIYYVRLQAKTNSGLQNAVRKILLVK